ncbi:MAG: pilus assembly protein [Oceanicaulis sp.]|nr:pilus assembly protein [Oceanicaulis sp.]
MIRRWVTDRSGASAVEAALLMPVFAVLLVAAVAFGQAFFVLGSAQWAVERTARELMIDGALTEAAFEQRLRELTGRFSAIDYEVVFAETLYGEVRVTEVQTVLRYPVRLPGFEPIWIDHRVEVHAPRGF